MVFLQNHCSDNFEPNSKDNSEFALLCSLLRGSTDFFSCHFKRKRSAIKTFTSKEVSCENGILHNHCSDNVEPISKDNSEFALQCSLLSGSTDFFFCISKGKRPAIKTVHSKEVSCENGILHNHCSNNVEPISKDNSEFAMHCYLLSG